jgi:hypothetical protein
MVPVAKDSSSVREEETGTFPINLPCTKTGQVITEYDGVRAVFEENKDRLAEIEAEKRKIDDDERKRKAYEWLKSRIYAYREPGDINCRVYDEEDYFGLRIKKCLWWSQKDVMSHAFILCECRDEKHLLPVTIALWNGGTKTLDKHIHWIRKECSGKRAVMILDVSGVGGLAPRSFNTMPPQEFSGVIFKLAYDMIWLDDSIAALRTYDVIRSLDMIDESGFFNTGDTTVYSCDVYGIYGLFAAFLDKRIRRTDISENKLSYCNVVKEKYYEPYDIMSITVPGVLKYLDIADIRRWKKGE